MVEEEEEELIWEPRGEGSSLTSASPMGRVMRTLLGCRPRHLRSAISKLGPSPSRSSTGAQLDESLCFLWRHAEDAAKREEPLDQILMPMIEHFREPKYSKQVFILIRWLSGNELLHRAILSNLTEIITRKKDHFIVFGWCIFVINLVELSVSQLFDEGNQERHITLLKILCRSIPCLLSIIRQGSILVDGFELPTRLSVAAADCILVLTEALSNKAHSTDGATSEKKLTVSKSKNKLMKLQPLSKYVSQCNQTHLTSVSEDLGTEFLLWDHLDSLSNLVEKLQAWSTKSLPLHEKGLKQVLKWLQELKRYYFFVQDEEDGRLLRNGVLLLSSCWKHYAALLRLENSQGFQHRRQMLDQYLAALEFYTQHDAEGDPGKLNSSTETRKFFLNCIALLCGRLQGEQLETVVSEIGAKLVNVLLSQLKSDHQDLVEVTMSIIRGIILRANVSCGTSAADTHQLGAILPSLLTLLDERDSTSKAVVLLLAEFCYVDTGGQGLKEVLQRLSCGTHCQRKNATDVILELVRGYSDSMKKKFPSLWQDVAKYMLECLRDEELIDQLEAPKLFPYFDPSIVLPQLVQLSYSENKKVNFSAANALVSVLKHHNGNFNVIETLLDSLSVLNQNSALSLNIGDAGKSVQGKSTQLQSGLKVDIDDVLRLTSQWSESVRDWGLLINQLIEKMFLNPSNAVLVRFMSYLSQKLAEAGDFVLQRVLSYMQEQDDMDESSISDRNHGHFASGDANRPQASLFNRLCPLLIIRLVPLDVFDNLESPALYGEPCSEENLKAKGDVYTWNRDSIAALLFTRAFGLFEYEDVRKLAAELCGHLHPQVLLPVVGYHLRCASQCRDTLKLKACLFSVCTSLVVRGRESATHPSMAQIREVIDFVLSWPSVDGDEVSKAQHGCIDCLALMICSEVQSSESWTDSPEGTLTKTSDHPGSGAATSPVLTCVIRKLTSNAKGLTMSKSDIFAHHKISPMQEKHPLLNEPSSIAPLPTTFVFCMANVLISACQKVASSGRNALANRIIPSLVLSIKSMVDSDIRAACLQVLFSAVYHLKSSVLPFSSDLLKLSVKALKKGSEKEKIAAAKLLASLMASEDDIVESILPGILEAKLALTSVSETDPSKELRQLCEKLLSCVTSPLGNAFPGM